MDSLERFSNDRQKAKSKFFPTNHQRSERRDEEPIRIPSNYLYNLLKAREKSRVHGAIGFASNWLKNWRDF